MAGRIIKTTVPGTFSYRMSPVLKITQPHGGVFGRVSALFNPEQQFFSGASCAKRLPHIALSVVLPVVFILCGVVAGEIIIFKHVLGNPSLAPLARELYSYTVTVSLKGATYHIVTLGNVKL